MPPRTRLGLWTQPGRRLSRASLAVVLARYPSVLIRLHASVKAGFALNQALCNTAHRQPPKRRSGQSHSSHHDERVGSKSRAVSARLAARPVRSRSDICNPVTRRRRDNPTTTMNGADDARKIDDALLRAFCAVQALCAGAIGIAYPAVLYALATWIFIFTGIVVCRELTEQHIPDERRRRVVFGYCWAALWHLWLRFPDRSAGAAPKRARRE